MLLFPRIVEIVLGLLNRRATNSLKHTELSIGLGLIVSGMSSLFWCPIAVVVAIPKIGLWAWLLPIPIVGLLLCVGVLVSSLVAWADKRVNETNAPTSATRRMGRTDCNRDAPAGFAAARVRPLGVHVFALHNGYVTPSKKPRTKAAINNPVMIQHNA